MPITKVRAPDGSVVKVNHPEGASSDEIIAFAQKNFGKEAINAWQRARPYVEPALEMTGLLAGGTLGAAAGAPVAGVGAAVGAPIGAGLGYSAARRAVEVGDYYLGGVPAGSYTNQALNALMDVPVGAALDMGGQVIGWGMNTLFKSPLVQNYLAPATRFAMRRGSKILNDALARDSVTPANAQNALLTGRPSNLTAAQKLAEQDVNAPTTQALSETALAREPAFGTVLRKGEQIPIWDAEIRNALEAQLKGDTAATLRAAREGEKRTITNALVPVLNRELEAAGTANRRLPIAEKTAQRMSEAASNKVTDVGRYTVAGEKAAEASKWQQPGNLRMGPRPEQPDTLVSNPLPLREFTHAGELAKRADELATKSADASLLFGEARRFAEYEIKALEEHGLKKLSSEPIINKMRSIIADEANTGNLALKNAMRSLIKELEDASTKDGYIGPVALDSFRKFGVNAAVRDAMVGAEKIEKDRLVGELSDKLKPVIVDAIENAGGTNYSAYLKAYSTARQQIAERKLSGKAAELWRTDKDAFVNLVRGQNEADIAAAEKVLGSGKYDVAKELSDSLMDTLRDSADVALRQARMAKGASEGKQAVMEIIRSDMPIWKLPSYLSRLVSSTNKAIDIFEASLSKNTKNLLTEAMKSPEGTVNLLNRLPPDSQKEIRRLLNKPGSWIPGRVTQALDISQENRENSESIRPRVYNALTSP